MTRLFFIFNKTILFVTVLAALSAHAGERELVDRVVAVVGDEVITLSELMEIARMAPDMEPDKLLEKLIEEKLIEIEAQRRGVEVTDNELDAAIETHIAKFGVSEDEFKGVLEQEGFTMEQFRKKIRSELMKVKFIKSNLQGGIEISEEDILNYYRRHPDEFRGEKAMHLALIFLPWSLEADAQERARTRNMAMEIIEKVKGGADFAELAKKYSKASNAAGGGDLDWVNPQNLKEPAFREAAANLGIGQISGVIELKNGCGLLFVHDVKSESLAPYETVKEEIQQILYSEKISEEINKIVSRLKQEVPIERLL